MNQRNPRSVLSARPLLLARLVFNLWVSVPPLRPMLNRFMSRFFGARAQTWDDRTGAFDPSRLSVVGVALNRLPSAPKRAVDFGTGTGAGAMLLARRYPSAWVLGIDVSEEMLSVARENANRAGVAARFAVGDSDDTGLEDCSVDLALFINAPPSLAEVERILDDDGTVVVTFTSGASTPFYISARRLLRAAKRAGLDRCETGAVGAAEYFVARKSMTSRPQSIEPLSTAPLTQTTDRRFDRHVAIARLAGRLSRGAGRGGGTSLPGKILLRQEPLAVGQLAKQIEHGCIVISATNGKTTTAGMVASILAAAGQPVIHNRAGANLPTGIATTLLDAAAEGIPSGAVGLFEVDEAWAPQVIEQLAPRSVVFSNLFRDQLDRYGELDTLAAAWGAAVATLPSDTELLLNADDPLVAGLGAGHGRTSFFGVDDVAYGHSAMQHAADSKLCRACGSPLVYSTILMGHLGHYSCPQCGFRRPSPTVAATSVTLRGMHGSSIRLAIGSDQVEVELPLPGLYNVYNAVAAAAAGHSIGIPFEQIAHGLETVGPAFGRVEQVELNGQHAAVVLIKNPAGANEVLRTAALQSGDLHLWVGLNDGIADGRDISWIWDADFEILTEQAVRVTCSGSRAEELALRLKYAGIDPELLHVDRDVGRSFAAALVANDSNNPVLALPTYTALLDLKQFLKRQGASAGYWEPADT